MSLLKDIGNLFSGGFSGLVDKVIDVAVGYFPPSMSDADKAKATLEIRKVAHQQEMEIVKSTSEAMVDFNQRIKDYEGTANDLKTIPYVGALIIFLRGAFRPLMAYAIGYVDLQVFSNAWVIPEGSVESVFWIVNLLVLGFFFGERTLKNLLPLLKEFLKK